MKVPPKIVTIVEHYAIAFASTAAGVWFSGDHHPLGIAKSAAAAVFGPVLGQLIAQAKKYASVYAVGKATLNQPKVAVLPGSATGATGI